MLETNNIKFKKKEQWREKNAYREIVSYILCVEGKMAQLL